MTTTNETSQRAIPSPPAGERVRVRGRLTGTSASIIATPTPSSQPSPPVGEKEPALRHKPQYGKVRTRTPNAREFARQLRHQSTDAEKRLWRLLRDRRFSEFKFRRQYACGIYFLDFCCTVAKLAVELDGGGHGFPDQRTRDEKRNQFLAAQGIKTLRFWNHQMRGELEAIRFEIWHALMERTGRVEEIEGYLPKPAPSPRPSPPMGERESKPPARERRVDSVNTKHGQRAQLRSPLPLGGEDQGEGAAANSKPAPKLPRNHPTDTFSRTGKAGRDEGATL